MLCGNSVLRRRRLSQTHSSGSLGSPRPRTAQTCCSMQTCVLQDLTFLTYTLRNRPPDVPEPGPAYRTRELYWDYISAERLGAGRRQQPRPTAPRERHEPQAAAGVHGEVGVVRGSASLCRCR